MYSRRKSHPVIVLFTLPIFQMINEDIPRYQYPLNIEYYIHCSFDQYKYLNIVNKFKCLCLLLEYQVSDIIRGCVATAGKHLFFQGTYSHTLVFPCVLVVLSVTFIPCLLCLWTNGFRLTDDGRLFPLYTLFLYQTIV